MSRELSPEEERLMQELRQELQNAPISVQQMLFVLGMVAICFAPDTSKRKLDD